MKKITELLPKANGILRDALVFSILPVSGTGRLRKHQNGKLLCYAEKSVSHCFYRYIFHRN